MVHSLCIEAQRVLRSRLTIIGFLLVYLDAVSDIVKAMLEYPLLVFL